MDSVQTQSGSSLQGEAGTTDQNRKDQAKQQAQETAGQAREHAGATAETARQEARQVVTEAKSQARNLTEEARSVGRSRADEQTQRLAGALHQVQQQATALLEGRTEDAGPLADYARQLTDTIGRYADRVEELGFDGLMRETSRFARRRPAAFLLAAAGAGLLVGRLGRGATDAQRQESQSRAIPSTTVGDTPLAPPAGTDLGPPEATTPPMGTAGAASAGVAETAGVASAPVAEPGATGVTGAPADETGTADDAAEDVRPITEDTFDTPVPPAPPAGSDTRERDPSTGPRVDDELTRDPLDDRGDRYGR